jgi:hypothetical protein
MKPPARRPFENTDVAALSAGAVAVVIGLFTNPGPWDMTGLVIGFTLVIIIVAFTWERTRWWLQSLAVAAAIALASLPATGFMCEAIQSQDPLSYLLGQYNWQCANERDPCTAQEPRIVIAQSGEIKKAELVDGKPTSRVTTTEQAVVWFGMLIILFIGDLILQSFRTSRQQEQDATQLTGE